MSTSDSPSSHLFDAPHELDAQHLPPRLIETAEDFNALGERDRLQLLLEFADELPELPERYRDDPDLLEPVPECQSPVFLKVDVDGDTVHPHVTAPREAPTTRGFASILVQGLDGESVQQVLDVPSDYPFELGLARTVSPLRLRGMTGILERIKAQVRRRIAERDA
ncbi:SufE family protein [Pseudoclavibacter sp. CFCC 11306]|uniref:SufE family protein n=1 Tax=Pseudoclavibacter sp. CFCC 11306 TaxID=1564493 RepID=UPI00130110DF|nr:SufE family protein [Pseudoclavibacter sp. CFCC 11306]KAB1658345.1 SufE family protein [Pseudoclavibacter sp. CFCC 11306]